MNSSATPSSPTPFQLVESLRAWLVLGCCLALLPALAHEAERSVPDEPGFTLGAALAAAEVSAVRALPSQRLAGYLVRGDAGVDRRASILEHGVVEAAWRWSPSGVAYAALGRHDTDAAHVEAAWVRREFAAGGDTPWSIQAGRMSPASGPVMAEAGHMDRFALMPLARRVTLDGDWMDDGVQVNVRRAWADASVDADVGVWRAVRFPGAGGSPWAPSLHVGVERGDWRGDLFAAAFAPQGRGAVASSIAGGHTHSAPDCSALRGGILCFAGNTRVMGGSLRWQSHDWPLTLQGAGWLRHDDGTLRSVNGEARHAARYGGGWLQAQWEVVPGWELAARSERIRAQAWLDGPGATLLAQEAGLIGSTPLRRDTAALAWQPRANLTLSAEIGRETQGSERVNFTVLRLRWHGQLDWPAGPSP